MTRLLTGTKAKPKKLFFINDKGNVVKIKQPDVMDVALLYGILLEKLHTSNKYH